MLNGNADTKLLPQMPSHERFGASWPAPWLQVYADFKVVAGVFTRDFRSHVLDSRMLVTVPACLEILLLSPSRPNREWASQIQYVIFDEIHCLREGGLVDGGSQDSSGKPSLTLKTGTILRHRLRLVSGAADFLLKTFPWPEGAKTTICIDNACQMEHSLHLRACNSLLSLCTHSELRLLTPPREASIRSLS